LNDANPQWKFVDPMAVRRRQLNATLLVDGKVLVTGGTDGSGNSDQDFNDLKRPIFFAELWDPATKKWKVMASASVARQYHSTGVLLSDATVLSAGGGEYAAAGLGDDAPDNHRDGQIFFPPYLFGDDRPAVRPLISSAPDSVTYGQEFTVGTPSPGEIKRVTWVRLCSVTHAYDQNQRFNELNFKAGTMGLQVTPPPDGNHAPPGHYMCSCSMATVCPQRPGLSGLPSRVPPATGQEEKNHEELICHRPPGRASCVRIARRGTGAGTGCLRHGRHSTEVSLRAECLLARGL
jgi:hypothetical protein